MKPLALILFLITVNVAVGQEFYIYPSRDTVKKFGVDFTARYQIEKKLGQAMFSMIALDLWDEWKDSCWADSTIITEQIFVDGSAAWGASHWIHRDPNDLSGFMNFIRSKTK